jgi:hypothetical protein
MALVARGSGLEARIDLDLLSTQDKRIILNLIQGKALQAIEDGPGTVHRPRAESGSCWGGTGASTGI